jgi:co-chaperonin GroES (HSP10)
MDGKQQTSRADNMMPLELEKLGSRLPNNNKVMVEIPNIKEITTNSGIIVPNQGEWDFNQALHENRTGIVVDICDKLTIKPRVKNYDSDKDKMWKSQQSGMMWETDIELEIGDEVIFGHDANMESYKIIVDGRLYAFIDYGDIFARKREGEITPINGYILFGNVYKTESALDYEKDVIQDKYGIVKYIGKPNKSYFRSGREDDQSVEFKVGDKVLFFKKFYGSMRYYIEDEMHRKFADEDLFAAQRHWVEYIY